MGRVRQGEEAGGESGQRRCPRRRFVPTRYRAECVLLLKSFPGYKQYDTGRKHMARMGDWRNDKDEEIALDGIGGVNILVKADVHRSGKPTYRTRYRGKPLTRVLQVSTFPAMRSRTKQRRRVSPRWPSEQDTKCSACPTTLSGTSIQTRSPGTHDTVPRPLRLRFLSTGIFETSGS